MFDIEVTGNWIEAVVWEVVAVVLCVQRFRIQPELKRVYAILAGGFFFFGISDMIEAQTGAWWEPWWLFVLKGSCVLVLLYAFREYFLIRQRIKEQDLTRRQETGEERKNIL